MAISIMYMSIQNSSRVISVIWTSDVKIQATQRREGNGSPILSKTSRGAFVDIF